MPVQQGRASGLHKMLHPVLMVGSITPLGLNTRRLSPCRSAAVKKARPAASGHPQAAPASPLKLHLPADSAFISTEAGLLELPPGAGKPPRPSRVIFERRPHDQAFAPPGDEPPVDPLMPLMPSMSLDSFLTVLDTRYALALLT